MQLQEIQKKTSFDLSALYDIFSGEKPHILPEISKGGQYIYLTTALMQEQINLQKYGFSLDTRIAFMLSDQDQLVAFIKADGLAVRTITIEQLASGTYTVFFILAKLICNLCQQRQIDDDHHTQMQFEYAEKLFFSPQLAHLVGQSQASIIRLLNKDLMPNTPTSATRPMQPLPAGTEPAAMPLRYC